MVSVSISRNNELIVQVPEDSSENREIPGQLSEPHSRQVAPFLPHYDITKMKLLCGPIFTRCLKKTNSVKEGEMVVRGPWGEET